MDSAITPFVRIPVENVSDSFEHIKDRLGSQWTDVDILNWIDEHFLLSSGYELKLINPHGAWSTKRHPMNKIDRGDMASVVSKQKSVETFSLRLEWRSPPWLVQDPDIKNHNDTQTLHWGTLLDGAERAWLMDKDKKNKMVQLAATTKIPGCRLYRRTITRDAAKFLVDWGNKKNDDATVTSPLAVWRSTEAIEISWIKHKNVKQLSKDSHGAKMMEAEKLQLANNMSQNFTWGDYTKYERTNTFFKDANKFLIQQGPDKSITIWQDLHNKFFAKADAPSLRVENFDAIFKLAADAMRNLKSTRPELIVHIVLLSMPRIDHAWGKCSLLPQGLPLLRSEKVSESNLKSLNQDMTQSKTIEQIDRDRAMPSNAAGQKRAVRGRKGGKLHASAADSSMEEMIVKRDGGKSDFYSILSQTQEFMMKIDPRQEAKIEAFGDIALYGVCTGEVVLVIRSQRRLIKGLKLLRTLFKSDMYKTAKLQPRPSDCDYDALTDTNVAALEDAVCQIPSDERIVQLETEHQASICEFSKYLQENSVFTVPIVCNQKVAGSLHVVMMALFQKTTTMEGGAWSDPSVAYQALMQAVCAQAMELLPSQFDDVVSLIELVKQHGKQDKLSLPAHAPLFMLNKDGLLAMRLQIVLHMACSIGVQCTLVNQGSEKAMLPYVPSLVMAAIRNMLETTNAALMVTAGQAESPILPDFVLIKENVPDADHILIKKFLDLAYELHLFCIKHDGKRYNTLRDHLSSSMEKESPAHSQWPPLCHKLGFKVTDVVSMADLKKLEVFASEKSACMSKIMEFYANRNSESKRASDILQDPLKATVAALMHMYMPDTLGQANAETAAATSNQPRLLDMHEWLAIVKSRETQNQSLTEIEVKQLIAKVTDYFLTKGVESYPTPSSDALKSNMHIQGFHKDDIIPKDVTLECNGEGSCRLHFWGKVVTEDVAKKITKGSLLAIGDGRGAGPRLYLDGRAFTNIASSQCCWAWLVPPLPKVRESACDGSPAKKAKTQGQVETATHDIVYEPFQVEMSSGRKLTYDSPVLVDCEPTEAHENANRRLFRKRQTIDDHEFPTSAVAADSKLFMSFAMK